MAILANRVRTGNVARDFFETVRSYLLKSLPVSLIFASSLLIYSSNNQKIKEYIFNTSSDIINPILLTYDSISQNIINAGNNISEVFNTKSENIALKLQNAKLQALIDEAARLKAEDLLLKKQLKFKEMPQAKIFLSTRLISNFSGIYSNGGIIGAGRKDGIEENQVISSEENIIGRVSYISDNYSRVMFITDVKSRIPVITSISKEKAILTGDGHNGGRLLYVVDGHKIKPGEHIMSSGDGKYYPYGIPIAKVVKVDNVNVYVEPLANLSKVQFVNVISTVK